MGLRDGREMRYRLHFEPMDYEGKDSDEIIKKYFSDGVEPPISKILLIDEDGFVIESKKD